MEPPTPHTPTVSPAKNAANKEFHIFLDDILSVYLRNTYPHFCFYESLVVIWMAIDLELK